MNVWLSLEENQGKDINDLDDYNNDYWYYDNSSSILYYDDDADQDVDDAIVVTKLERGNMSLTSGQLTADDISYYNYV